MNIWTDIALSRRPMAAFWAIGLGWGVFAGYVPPIKAQIGASDAVYGGLILLASLGSIGAMWLAPAAAARLGKWAMPLGCLAMGIGFALVGTAQTPAVFLLSMVLVATGTGVADVLGNAEIAALEAKSSRSLMSLNHAKYSFAFAGGALAAGAFRAASWTPAETMLVYLAATCVLFLAMKTPRVRPGDVPETPAAKGPLPVALIWLGGGVVLAAFLSEAATEGWSALHLERSLGASAAHGALGPALFGVTMGVGRLCGHALAARFSDLTLIAAACVMAGAGLVLAAAAPTLALAYAGFACAGLGISVVVPLALGLVGRSAPAPVRLATIARATVIGYAAFFFGPPFMGGIAQLFGLRMSFGLVGLGLVVVALVLVPALARQVGPR